MLEDLPEQAQEPVINGFEEACHGCFLVNKRTITMDQRYSFGGQRLLISNLIVELGWVGRTLVGRFVHGRKKQREAVTLAKLSLAQFGNLGWFGSAQL